MIPLLSLDGALLGGEALLGDGNQAVGVDQRAFLGDMFTEFIAQRFME